MTLFDEALEFCLRWEGPYEDDPNDPGGETKYGIAATYWPPDRIENILRREVAIKDLTRADAAILYRHGYWNVVGCPDFPDPVAWVMLDFAVNPGPGAAAKALQRIVGVNEDGSVGPKTKAAALAFCVKRGGVELAKMLLMARARYYVTRAENKGKYLLGWINRTMELGWLITQPPKENDRE